MSDEHFQIRLAQPDDAAAVLDFISEMDFSPRTMATWTGLQMGAMTAWREGRLVAAIPFEPREIFVAPSQTVRVLHETCVAVHPEFRAAGLGTGLQNALVEAKPGGAEFLAVYREAPESPAYRWYLRSGFKRILRVDSFFVDEPSKVDSRACGYDVRPHDESDDAPRSTAPGELCRAFVPWLSVHPYASRYRFYWLTASGGRMLLGVGRMHSQTERADVLYTEGDPIELFRCAEHASATHGWSPVRYAESQATPLVKTLGLRSGWTFDFLVRPLIARARLNCDAWRYQGVDFA